MNDYCLLLNNDWNNQNN